MINLMGNFFFGFPFFLFSKEDHLYYEPSKGETSFFFDS